MFSKPVAVLAASTIMLAGLATATLARPGAPLAAPAAAPEETGAMYKKLTESVGPALVTVKFVMKVEGMGDDGGRDMERTGLIVEPGGLVAISNAMMGGMAARAGINAVPTNIKVLVGDDTEGLKAKILARDSDLDLCWIQIDDEKAKGKTFTAVDFSSGAPAAVGDKLFAVDRLGKFFDHALSVEEGRVGGATRKPRALLIPAGFANQNSTLGAPMFNTDGKVVGLNILQIPDKEDMEGGDSGGEDNFAVLILPAAEVVKATTRGKEMAAKNPPAEEKAAETPSERAPDEKK